MSDNEDNVGETETETNAEETETEQNPEQKEVSEEFKEMVVNYVTLDDEIREKMAELKELKDERKQYEQFILDYLEEIDEKAINITGGKLRRNISNSKSPLKQDLIEEALFDLTNNKDQANQMTKYILNKRPIVQRVNLKRTMARKKKKAPANNVI